MREYLGLLNQNDEDRRWSMADPHFKQLEWAYAWFIDTNHRKTPRWFMEPLMLTAASFEHIAKWISGDNPGDPTYVDPNVYRQYMRLFFSVRGSDDQIVRGCYARCAAACDNNVIMDAATPVEVVWRNVAFQLGFAPLIEIWKWPSAETGVKMSATEMATENWRAAQATMLQRMLTNSVPLFDLNSYLGQYTMYERMLRETGQIDTNQEQLESLQKILAMHKPHMLAGAKIVDENEAVPDVITSEQIQSRFSAQQAVTRGPVKDLGPEKGEAALQEIIDTKFKG